MRSEDLKTYLEDHLRGSAGAVILIRELAGRQSDPREREYFSRLEWEVEGDRTILKNLLAELGGEPGAIHDILGGFAARVGLLKFSRDGFEPGELGSLEALEMLALGIQGKRLLWKLLTSLGEAVPAGVEVDFRKLESEAVRQRDEVEERRMRAGLDLAETSLSGR